MNWHSVREAAPIIGLNVDNIYALIATKRLGHRRVGVRKGSGKIQISDDHIAAFLKSCEVEVGMEHAKPPKVTSRATAKPTRARGDHRPIVRPDGKPLELF